MAKRGRRDLEKTCSRAQFAAKRTGGLEEPEFQLRWERSA